MMVSRFCVRSPRGGFWKKSKWPWNMVQLMPCRNPGRLYIHFAFTYFVGPSSIVWSELGPAPSFPPMRVLEVKWSWDLSLVCEVALKQHTVLARWSGHVCTGHLVLNTTSLWIAYILPWPLHLKSGKAYDLVCILSGWKLPWITK